MASYWDFIPAALSLASTIYGTKQKSAADAQAAATAATAQANAVKAEQMGLATAAQVTGQNQGAASPGLLADQAIIARGTALTPAQQQAVTDANTTAINAMNGTGLRGSARATSAVIADTTARNTATFEQQNQNNANTAAGQLTPQYFAAGNSLAGNAVASGTSGSQGLVNTGNIAGNTQITQGALQGQAIGDIGATAANLYKSNIVQDNLGVTKDTAAPAPTATPAAGLQTQAGLNYNAITGAPKAAPTQYKLTGQGSVM